GDSGRTRSETIPLVRAELPPAPDDASDPEVRGSRRVRRSPRRWTFADRNSTWGLEISCPPAAGSAFVPRSSDYRYSPHRTSPCPQSVLRDGAASVRRWASHSPTRRRVRASRHDGGRSRYRRPHAPGPFRGRAAPRLSGSVFPVREPRATDHRSSAFTFVFLVAPIGVPSAVGPPFSRLSAGSFGGAADRRGVVPLTVEHARGDVTLPVSGFERRLVALGTVGDRVGTSGMKSTAGRWFDRARESALDGF